MASSVIVQILTDTSFAFGDSVLSTISDTMSAGLLTELNRTGFDAIVFRKDIILFNALAALALVIVYLISRELFLGNMRKNRRFYSLLAVGWLPNILYLGVQLVEGRGGLDIFPTKNIAESVSHILNILSSGIFLLAARTQFSKTWRRLLRFEWVILVTSTILICYIYYVVTDSDHRIADADWFSVTIGMLSIIAVSRAFQNLINQARTPENWWAQLLLIIPLLLYSLLQLAYLVPNVELTPQHDLSSVWFFLGGCFKWIHLIGLMSYMKLYITEYRGKSEQSYNVTNFVLELEHELNTPLAALDVLSMQLTEQPRNNELVSIGARNIAMHVESTKARVESFKSFLRVAGKTVGSDIKRICNLNAIIQASITKVHMRLKFEQHIDDQFSARTCFEARETQIHQVFENLIKNSIEATEQYLQLPIRVSTLTLRDGQRKSHVQAVVSNAFALKPEMEIDRVFERGYSTKNKYDGGIGLYIAKKGIEDNNGKIEAKIRLSNNVNWFVVTVTLPYHKCEES